MKVYQPAMFTAEKSGKELRIRVVQGVPEGFAHPKGFYTATTSQRISYETWREKVGAALRNDFTDMIAIIPHPEYGDLWAREAMRSYTDRFYQGYCVRCGRVRVGSLANKDHELCPACKPVYGAEERFCRCCGLAHKGHGSLTFGPCHDWRRYFRREF